MLHLQNIDSTMFSLIFPVIANVQEGMLNTVTIYCEY